MNKYNKVMKKVLFFLVVLFFAANVFAQNGNDRISYQAVVRNSDNRLVYNENLTVTVTITNVPGGPVVYSETHNVTSNANGLISLLVGNGTEHTGNWNDIQWKTARLSTRIEKAGNHELVAEQDMPLTAVPYARYADYTEQVNPEATTVQNIYNKMHADSLALGTLIDANATAINNRITTDSAALHNALIDTAAAIRGSMSTQANRLQANIDTASSHVRSALIDTAAAIRGSMSTQVNQLQANIDTASSHVRSALIDTAAAIRATVNLKANAADVYTKTETYTKAEVDALLAQMQIQISNMPKMRQEHFVVAVDQTTTETVFTLSRTIKTDCIYRVYVNGVMVGGSNNGALLPVANEENKVKYDGTKNGDYMLKADDVVTIVYWYIEDNSTPSAVQM